MVISNLKEPICLGFFVLYILFQHIWVCVADGTDVDFGALFYGLFWNYNKDTSFFVISF